MKSANQKYKESGSTLSFKDWLNQESNLPTQKTNEEFVQNVKVANIPLSYILIGVGVIVVGVIAYQVYKKRQ